MRTAFDARLAATSAWTDSARMGELRERRAASSCCLVACPHQAPRCCTSLAAALGGCASPASLTVSPCMLCSRHEQGVTLGCLQTCTECSASCCRTVSQPCTVSAASLPGCLPLLRITGCVVVCLLLLLIPPPRPLVASQAAAAGDGG